MTKEETKQAIAVMQHYVDGGEVEVRSQIGGKWMQSCEPIWNWEECKYRIKPKPQLTIEVGRWYQTKGNTIGLCERKCNEDLYLTGLGWMNITNILREVRVEAVE